MHSEKNCHCVWCVSMLRPTHARGYLQALATNMTEDLETQKVVWLAGWLIRLRDQLTIHEPDAQHQYHQYNQSLSVRHSHDITSEQLQDSERNGRLHACLPACLA